MKWVVYKQKTFKFHTVLEPGILGGSNDKECTCDVGDPGSIPGWGRSPGDGNGNPLQ